MGDGSKAEGTPPPLAHHLLPYPPTPLGVARLHATLYTVTPYIALAAGTRSLGDPVWQSSLHRWNILEVNRPWRHAPRRAHGTPAWAAWHPGRLHVEFFF